MLLLFVGSDEQQLGTGGQLDEVRGADDVLYLSEGVLRGQVLHVRRHAAGPEVTSGVDDLLEELGFLVDDRDPPVVTGSPAKLVAIIAQAVPALSTSSFLI